MVYELKIWLAAKVLVNIARRRQNFKMVLEWKKDSGIQGFEGEKKISPFFRSIHFDKIFSVIFFGKTIFVKIFLLYLEKISEKCSPRVVFQTQDIEQRFARRSNPTESQHF
jgi:hypothetical protein